jgi:Zn-dependent protease
MVALHIVPSMGLTWGVPAMEFIAVFVLANVVLGLFNLLPIPPLDGGRIAVGLLPERAAKALASVERGGILIVIGVIYLLPGLLYDVFGVRFDLLQFILRTFGRPLVQGLAWLAGSPEFGTALLGELFGA